MYIQWRALSVFKGDVGHSSRYETDICSGRAGMEGHDCNDDAINSALHINVRELGAEYGYFPFQSKF